jgi:hypothetical protein
MQNWEGLRFVRLMMVLSSLTPLFLLWAVRGMQPIPDKWLVPLCVGLIVLPNLVLLARIAVARRRGYKHTLAVAKADDHRDHLLVYLFAMLIPLFDANVGKPRDSAATILALIFVVFLFLHLNLHYMNVLFALFGFRVFTIHSPTEPQPIVLLTRKSVLAGDSRVHAYRLSNTVFIEMEKS